MALTPAVQLQLKNLIAAEGGLQAFLGEVQALYVANMQNSALALLSPSITATVQDWAALKTYAAQPQQSGSALFNIMSAIALASTVNDSTNLGPYLWALYKSVKDLQGL